jgi:hypothetical protein
MAPHLTGLDGGASLRRLARGAKLSVARGGRINLGTDPAFGGNRRIGA